MTMDYSADGQDWAVDAEVAVPAMLAFSDLLPVATELNRRHVSVRVKRTDTTPPMAADPDLAVHLILLAAIAGAEALRKVAGLLADDLYKGVRSGLLALLGKARARDASRPWNLGVTIGGQNFYFQGPRDGEDLVRGLRAMAKIVDGVSDDLLDGTQELPPEPGGGGWYWHSDKGLWVPTPEVKAAVDHGRKR